MTEIDLTPVTRLEYDIDAILNDHAVAEPITRIELILADIVAGNTTTVEPVTRIETYLAIISGADYPVPEPVTRIETFLAIIAGEDYETPEAVTRLEGLLAEWVEKGSGIWKTVTGALIHLTDALASPMQKCEVTLEPIQAGSGDPSPTNVRPITGWTGCEVTRAGLNICVVKNLYIGGVSGLAIGNDGVLACFNGINGQTYRISGLSGDRNILYKFRGKMDDIKSGASMSVAIGSPSLPYVFTADETCIYCFYRNSTWSESIANSMKVTIGDSASDYEAPNITTLSVTFPALGKNLFDGTLVNGIVGRDGIYSSSANRITSYKATLADNMFLKVGTYTLSASNLNYGTVITKDSDGTIIDNFATAWSELPLTFTTTKDSFVFFSLRKSSDANISADDFTAQVEKGSQATSYEPYTNTVYGGKYDFISGGLKPYKEYDSYNGETLTGEWMSSIDKYVSGTTPTIGAQVVDLDGYDTTVQLTPQEISTLAGENNVWSNGDSVKITYKAQAS